MRSKNASKFVDISGATGYKNPVLKFVEPVFEAKFRPFAIPDIVAWTLESLTNYIVKYKY